MNFKTHTLKQVTTIALLFSLAVGSVGCGCNDDSTLVTPPLSQPSVGGVRSEAPPIPVTFNEEPPKPLRIDVVFVLDDSDSMIQVPLGLIPNHPSDRRERSQAAQAIMQNIQETVRARLLDEWSQEQVEAKDIDFAFGVARYEDFGGPFTPLNRDADDGDIDTFRNDTDARPFILNMPVLRQEHPEFVSRFTAALARTAPGDGNPISSVPTVDAQTGIEALWQLAAPDASGNGVFGGFDADGDGNTLGSGPPTSLDTTLNPQTKPGATGDVPAISFLLSPDKDPDGHDVFMVADENKQEVSYIVGGDMVVRTISSGDLGGAGWRRDSARFIILASDIATVAPTETPPQGELEFGAELRTPADTEVVTSSAGNTTPTGDPRDAPRTAFGALLRSFDSGHRLSPFLRRRIGVANGPIHAGGNGVAPVGAHTVQATINALNELDIEVLCMGAPFEGQADTKPGESGVNGDEISPIGEFDVVNPILVRPEIAPWRWFTATSLLTMPRVTSTAPLGGTGLYPAVYNLGTIWPFQVADAEGTDTSNIRTTVVDDLVERIRDWVDTPFLLPPALTALVGPSPSAAARPDSLPTLDFLVTLDLEWPPAEMDIVQVAPLDAGNPVTHFEINVSIPVYWDDLPAPADVPLNFPSFSFVAKDDTVPLPASVLVPFTMSANLVAIGNDTPATKAQVDQIIAFIKARGDGTDPAQLADENDQIIQAKGVLLITVRSATDGGPGVQLVTYERGSFIVNDLTAGRDHSDQVGGSGAAFPPPPAGP